MALIVVAEDNGDVRDVIGRILRRAGHTVIEVPDGAAGLQAVQEHRPDALVSDIDMPLVSGVELCQAIRADPELCHLPVLFVSGSLIPGDTRPTDAEVTAVINKPFVARNLTAAVDRALESGHRPGQQPIQCP
jgi:CheY-like chemotaxis protein